MINQNSGNKIAVSTNLSLMIILLIYLSNFLTRKLEEESTTY